MNLRENIKSKVDQLDASELKIVGILIDGLSTRNKTEVVECHSDNSPYLKVIELLKLNFMSSTDISMGRQERI